ncbi:MAG: hypothetical protein SCM11_19700 [Bacillota bacterium]|nr:hypothetical protein [Bacillota bacterium]
MKLYYDLHIHSGLSPCADKTMTPHNIAAMAKLKGLDVIAVTDHQSCGNCAAVMAVSARMDGPTVLPGLEIESAEEIHLLCLMPDLTAASWIEKQVRDHLPDRPNRPEIFGEQLLFDENDHVIGRESCLLLQPCTLDCLSLALLVADQGGVLIPAHVDRDAYSMLQTLGTIPADYPTRWLEYADPESTRFLVARMPQLRHFMPLYNSDAHRLGSISEKIHALNVTDPLAIFSALRP